MPTWNPMQKKAIETKQKNILVSASAGSGKTTVLIARLMDLVLKERIPISSILAMTFTEAAANEMKKRLAASLQDALRHSTEEEEKAYISRQLASIPQAHISTIHSFCLSIVQDYYYVIHLDARRVQTIMDNGMMAKAQKEALEEAFQLQYDKQEKDFLRLTMMFSSRSENDDALYAMIRSLAALSSSKPDPEAWLQQITEMYHHKRCIEELPSCIKDTFYDYLQVQLQRYREVLEELAHLYRFRYDSEVKKKAAVDQKLTALNEVEAALSQRDYESFRLSLRGVAQGIVPPSPEKEDSQYTALRKQSQELEDELLSLLFSEQQMMEDIAALYPMIKKLTEITLAYRRSYERRKQELQVIDFDDMEHFALAILEANNGQVAAVYRELFQEIMVDEFQDSNDVQNELVMRICKANNVFRVGDIKQSIYGFRHARPQLMKGLIEHSGAQDEVIYLSNNYRSKEMIVEFNNILFKRLMNIEGFSCSYAKEDDVETGVAQQKENNVPVCFHAIYHDRIKKDHELIWSKNEFKASYIAHQILEMHRTQGRSWREFAVLVRGNARKDDMKKIFDELHIPYFIDVKSGFYQSSAVQIILSALHALVQPHEDIAFTAAMTSPLFQMTITDFAKAKLKKEKQQSYYAWFKEHPIGSFPLFEELRKEAFSVPLTKLLNRLFDLHSYYELHTTLQEKTNLDLLFEKAVQFEEQYATGVSGFLSQIEQIKDAQTAEAIPIGSEADVVRVMSIHQSKGLQFPIVFLWSSDRMTPIEFKDFCIADADNGIAMKCMDLPDRYVRTTIPRIAMEHKKDREELEEEMRILYVATTRAQQEMHIVDCILSLEAYQKPLSMSSIYERKGYTSWILQAFLQEPSPLFTIKEVPFLWQDEPLEEEAPHIHEKLRYTLPIKEKLQISTATELKKEQLAALQLSTAHDGAAYGTMMHRMIEQLDDIRQLSMIADRNGYVLSGHDKQVLAALLNQPLYQKALTREHYHELPFMVKEGEKILHGYIDFMAVFDDHILLLDFKTDRLEKEEEFRKEYTQQLSVYQRAMNTLYPNKPCIAYIYSLHLGRMIPISC